MIEGGSNYKSNEGVSEYGYALSRSDYSLKNALCWGNCIEHFKKAGSGNLKDFFIHGVIGCIELIPVVSQITCLAETAFVKELVEFRANESNRILSNLIENNVIDSNVIDPFETLMLAILDNDIEAVEKMIEKGDIELNKQDSAGKTPLILAAGKGYEEICEILLKKGAEINRRGGHGETPFIAAARAVQNKVCEMLIKHGAWINYRDFQERTALSVVIENQPLLLSDSMQKRNLEIVKMLAGENQKFFLMIDQMFNLEEKDFSLDKQLIKSIHDDDVSIVETFYKCGVDFNKKDDLGKTPLYYAVMQGREEIIKTLVKNGVLFEELLFEAISKNDGEVVKKIIESKLVDVNEIDAKGRTPLIMASKAGREEICEMLLKNGADVNRGDHKGQTALMWAAYHGSLKMTKRLLEDKTYIDHQDEKGFTAIMYAVSQGNILIYKELLKANADLSLQCNSGCTLLAVAAWAGRNKLFVKILKKFGEKKLEIKDGSQVLYGFKGGRAHDYKDLFKKIVELKPEELKKFKGNTLLKALGHSSQLKQEETLLTPLSKEDLPLNIELEGAWSPLWFNKMHKATKLLEKNHPTVLDEKEIHLLSEILSRAADFKSTDPKMALELIQNDQPVVFEAGYSTHSVIILVWGSYFILCNRGESRRSAVEVFQYDREKLTLEVLKEIVDLKDKKAKDYKDLMFERLPEMLNLKEDEIGKCIKEHCPLLDQIAGHCSWVSAETSVWAFLVLLKIREKSNPNIEEIVKEETSRFMSWLVFNQLYHLERYMNVYELRGKPENLKEKFSLKDVYEINDDLIEKAFIASYEQIPDKMIAPSVAEQRDRLFKIFMKGNF